VGKTVVKNRYPVEPDSWGLGRHIDPARGGLGRSKNVSRWTGTSRKNFAGLDVEFAEERLGAVPGASRLDCTTI
jgi:hypothetical protein